MKTFLLIILANLLQTAKTDAQTINQAVGLWRYTNGTDTVTMYFKNGTMTAGTEIFPILIGYHMYVKNGQVIENTLKDSSSRYTHEKYSITIFNNEPQSVRNDGYLKDLVLNNTRYIILTKINSTKMDVYLTYIQGVRRGGAQSGFTLPRHFTLSKL